MSMHSNDCVIGPCYHRMPLDTLSTKEETFYEGPDIAHSGRWKTPIRDPDAHPISCTVWPFMRGFEQAEGKSLAPMPPAGGL